MVAKDIPLQWYDETPDRSGFVIVRNPKLYNWLEQNKSYIQYSSTVQQAHQWKLNITFTKPGLETEFIMRWLV